MLCWTPSPLPTARIIHYAKYTYYFKPYRLASTSICFVLAVESHKNYYARNKTNRSRRTTVFIVGEFCMRKSVVFETRNLFQISGKGQLRRYQNVIPQLRRRRKEILNAVILRHIISFVRKIYRINALLRQLVNGMRLTTTTPLISSIPHHNRIEN